MPASLRWDGWLRSKRGLLLESPTIKQLRLHLLTAAAEMFRIILTTRRGTWQEKSRRTMIHL